LTLSESSESELDAQGNAPDATDHSKVTRLPVDFGALVGAARHSAVDEEDVDVEEEHQEKRPARQLYEEFLERIVRTRHVENQDDLAYKVEADHGVEDDLCQDAALLAFETRAEGSAWLDARAVLQLFQRVVHHGVVEDLEYGRGVNQNHQWQNIKSIFGGLA